MVLLLVSICNTYYFAFLDGIDVEERLLYLFVYCRIHFLLPIIKRMIVVHSLVVLVVSVCIAPHVVGEEYMM